MNWGANPESCKNFFSSPKRLYRFWDPLSLLFSEYQVSFPGSEVCHHLHLLSRLRMSETMLLLPVYAFMGSICSVLPFLLLCQWSATKRDKDTLGDGSKKSLLRAWRVLYAYIRAGSWISLVTTHTSHAGLLLLLLLLIIFIVINMKINKHCAHGVWDIYCVSSAP
jgi:hypothetical protein